MEFFTKLLKINHSSRSPSPGPGPSPSNQNEAVKEVTMTKERIKQEEETSQTDLLHHTEHILRSTKENRRSENASSKSHGNIPTKAFRSDSGVRYDSFSDESFISQRNETRSMPSLDRSCSPPTYSEVRCRQPLELSANATPTNDAMKSFMNVAEAQDAVNAMKSNIEVLAYLKKSELTERHKESIERVKLFLAGSSENSQWTGAKDTGTTQGHNLYNSQSVTEKNASVGNNLNSNIPYQTKGSDISPIDRTDFINSKTLNPAYPTAGNSQIFKEGMRENKQFKTSEPSHSRAKLVTGGKFENPNFDGLRVSSLPEEASGVNCDFNPTLAKEEGNHHSELLPRATEVCHSSSKLNKLTRQSAQSSFLESTGLQEIDFLNESFQDEVVDRKQAIYDQGSKYDSAPGRFNFNNEHAHMSSPVLITKPIPHIKEIPEIYMSPCDTKPDINYTLSLAKKGRVDSQKLIKDCNFEKTLQNIIPTDLYELNKGNEFKFTIPNKVGELGTIKCDDVVQCADTRDFPVARVENLARSLEISPTFPHHTNLIEQRQYASDSCIPNRQIEEQTPQKIRSTEDVTGSKIEPGSENGNKSGFINIYMKGEVGNSVKIEKIGDLFIGDSSRKNSSHSLTEMVEAFAGDEEREGDGEGEGEEREVDFESDSLDRSDEISECSSEDGFDFEIEFVDDIEERLKGSQEAGRASSEIHNKLGRLLSSLDCLEDDEDDGSDGNNLLRPHESEIDIHAPTEYLTVQRPRRKRSLRIRLSPVIEILDESVSPSILFDFAKKSHLDLHPNLNANSKAVQVYAGNNSNTWFPSNSEANDEARDKLEITEVFADKDFATESENESDNQAHSLVNSEMSCLPCDRLIENQLQIMIHSPSNSLNNQSDSFERTNLESRSKSCSQVNGRALRQNNETIATGCAISESQTERYEDVGKISKNDAGREKVMAENDKETKEDSSKGTAENDIFQAAVMVGAQTSDPTQDGSLIRMTNDLECIQRMTLLKEGVDIPAEEPGTSQIQDLDEDLVMKPDLKVPVSLKELCEATIYNDFESRNIDTSNQRKDGTLKKNKIKTKTEKKTRQEGENTEPASVLTPEETSRKAVENWNNSTSTRDCRELVSDELPHHSIEEEKEKIRFQKQDGRCSDGCANERDASISDGQSDPPATRVDEHENGTEEIESVADDYMAKVLKDDQADEIIDASQEDDGLRAEPHRCRSDDSARSSFPVQPGIFQDSFPLSNVSGDDDCEMENRLQHFDIPFFNTSTESEQLEESGPNVSNTHGCIDADVEVDANSELRMSDLIQEDLNSPPSSSSSTTKVSNDTSVWAPPFTNSLAEKENDHHRPLASDSAYTQDDERVPQVLTANDSKLQVVGRRIVQKEKELEQLSSRNLAEIFDDKEYKQEVATTSVQYRTDKTSSDELKVVVREYEEIIAGLMEIVERDRNEFDKERLNLQKEITELISHLNSLELAFNDIHLKYEKSKIVITGFKSNEELLKQCITDMEMVIMNHEKRYSSLKEHATSELQRANNELHTMRRDNDAKLASYNELLKKCEVQLKSLQEIVNQKMEENTSLMKICDDLIQRVSHINADQ